MLDSEGRSPGIQRRLGTVWKVEIKEGPRFFSCLGLSTLQGMAGCSSWERTASDVPWLAAPPVWEGRKVFLQLMCLSPEARASFHITLGKSAEGRGCSSTGAPVWKPRVLLRAGAHNFCFKEASRDHKCSFDMTVPTSMSRDHRGSGILPWRIQILIILLLKGCSGQKVCWADSTSLLASEQ